MRRGFWRAAIAGPATGPIAGVILGLAALMVPGAGAQAAVALPGGQPLSRAFAERLLLDALAAEGFAEAAKVVFEAPRLPLGNEAGAATLIEVAELRYEPQSGRFDALLVGTVAGAPRFRLPAAGRVRRLVERPVLTRAVAAGEQIAAADVDWLALPASPASARAIADAELVIGAEARRRLQPGRLLTGRDLGPLRLVRRNRPVRLIFERPGLRLRALGLARGDGGRGETVIVVNQDSRQQVQGVVTGPDEVTVAPGALPALAARCGGACERGDG